jgi:hypothetical protein
MRKGEHRRWSAGLNCRGGKVVGREVICAASGDPLIRRTLPETNGENRNAEGWRLQRLGSTGGESLPGPLLWRGK